MGNFEVALPVDASDLDPLLSTVDREGVDGVEKTAKLFSSDQFVGEVLSGNWVKGDDGAILGPHTQLITGGELQLTGKSHSAGDEDYCWIRSKSKLLIQDGVVLDIHLKLPSHSTANAFLFAFVLTPNVSTLQPNVENDMLEVAVVTNSSVYSILVQKKVSGTSTVLLNYWLIDNNEGTFRIKFAESGLGYTNVYFHDGSGAVDESEDEVADSPFALNLNFDIAYPYFMLDTSETTNRTVSSEGVTVSYPARAFDITYSADAAGRLLGRCKVFDTTGSSDEDDWVEVFDCDHTFLGDCILQNGLVRYKLTNAQQYGLEPFFWTGAEWKTDYSNILFAGGESGSLAYTHRVKLLLVTAEKIMVEIVFHDSAIEDYDNYIRVQFTLRRGSYTAEFLPTEVFPVQTWDFQYLSSERFGFVGDPETHDIGDLFLTQTAENTTLTRNYGVKFEPT